MSDLLDEWWRELPTVMSGLSTSLLLTVCSLTIGVPLALGLAILSRASTLAFRWMGIAVVEVGRGTPALIVLHVMYFGLPQVGVTLSSFTAAVAALAIVASAYMSEIVRAGLDAVPHGQWEAATAAGFSRLDRLRFVVIPQALRISTPPLLSFSIVIFQATSLAFSVGVSEMLSRAYQIGATQFVFLQALTLAGLGYALIVIPASLFVRRLSNRIVLD